MKYIIKNKNVFIEIIDNENYTYKIISEDFTGEYSCFICHESDIKMFIINALQEAYSKSLK